MQLSIISVFVSRLPACDQGLTNCHDFVISLEWAGRIAGDAMLNARLIHSFGKRLFNSTRKHNMACTESLVFYLEHYKICPLLWILNPLEAEARLNNI
jgi:hypothetical protein